LPGTESIEVGSPQRFKINEETEMTKKFTGQELVDIAIRIEKNGAQLYKKLAEQTEFATVKNAFNALANEEKKHIASFDRIQEIIGSADHPEAYPGEYSQYLQALADENVFAKEDVYLDLAGKVVTIEEALELAIMFEKETLIFLHGIVDALQKDDFPVLNELVLQEKEHLQKLAEIKRALSNK
jgi:rubrerythrin